MDALPGLPAQTQPVLLAAPGVSPGVGEASEIGLEHWIYGVSPDKGYGTRAVSSGLNPQLYIRHLAGHFTPVRVEKTTSGSTVIDARMIHPANAAGELILSILGRGAADEYNRPTIQNHTVIVPQSLLRSGRLTLASVEKAAVDYDRLHPTICGTMEPLFARIQAPSETLGGAVPVIRRLMTKAAMDTLVTRILGDPHGRTLVLCRGATNEARNELLYAIVETLCLDAEVPLFPCISDAPTLSAMNHFRLATASRGVRADASWMLLDASIEKAALPTLRSKALIYARVASAYGL
ncbi:MAG: hypothetical protein KGI98_11785 [Euryarchaeota archaeon]|nr:hypothetical protein [Euryarchaeota archaeon]MDE2045545.1 hypothetical protein [Thermoplasmata archaeon]